MIVSKKLVLWEVTRFLTNSKWSFAPVSLVASTLSIILELISKPLTIFRAGPWNRSVGIVVNNCWIYFSCIFFCPCENSLWLLDVFALILLFSARRNFVKTCMFRMELSTASTDVLYPLHVGPSQIFTSRFTVTSVT